MGAIAPDGVQVLSDDLIHELQIPRALVDRVAAREQAELERRTPSVSRFKAGDQPPRLMIAILVDDGLATGSTMRAAVVAVRAAAVVGRRRGARRCARIVRGLAPHRRSSRLSADARSLSMPSASGMTTSPRRRD